MVSEYNNEKKLEKFTEHDRRNWDCLKQVVSGYVDTHDSGYMNSEGNEECGGENQSCLGEYLSHHKERYGCQGCCW